jgi:hypothetical protein
VSAAKNAVKRWVVVDGSNIATEGRTAPSLNQLDEAVTAYLEEFPGTDVIVVADATFEHRVLPADRARFKEAELAGEIVTPPAGAIGRGDAFILKIATRIGAVVLSNDSFQEFHEEHPWLFEPNRLIGGKPVPGVGWVFTPRLPVRGTKPTRSAKKLTVALPSGATPKVGDTLTPVKKVAAPKVAKVAEKPVAKASTKAPAKKAAVKTAAPAKKAAPATKLATKKPVADVTPPLSVKRGRQPVNPADVFDAFVARHKISSKVTGVVLSFTSHGAVIEVGTSDGGTIECYAPNANLGTPPPARARDVLQRGDRRSFTLLALDPVRRIAELALR